MNRRSFFGSFMLGPLLPLVAKAEPQGELPGAVNNSARVMLARTSARMVRINDAGEYEPTGGYLVNIPVIRHG